MNTQTDTTKTYVVLEPAVLCGRLSGRFFRFCLWRAPVLWLYAPLMVWAGLLRLLAVNGKTSEKSAAYAWRFLKAVPDLPAMASSFQKRKKLALPSGTGVLVSDAPLPLLTLLFPGAELLANPYDLGSGRFMSYAPVKKLLESKGDIPSLTAGLGKYPPAGERKYAAFGKIFPTARKAYFYGIGRALLRSLLLTALGVLLGVASLYFAREGVFDLSMFRSYFTTGHIAFLNILPAVLLMFLFYALFNRVYLAFLATFVLTLVPAWVSYFKFMYRNDPFFFEDIVLIREAKNMTNSYEIKLTAAIWVAIAAGILISAALIFAAKPYYKRASERVLAFLLTGIVCFGLFQNVYLNDDVYAANKNEAHINRWSPTEQFVSRGFLYPFLYSAKDYVGSTQPYDYSEEAVNALRKAFPEKDIPAEQKVNFIFIMLESFNDFSRFAQIPFTENPFAPWDALAEESISGRLVVNIFGGGTVDTERRVMSGLLRQPTFKRKTNTYVSYFAEQGYTTFGGHPNNEWFYKRYRANKNIGFADYAFTENYFSAFDTPKKDAVFLPEVLRLYEQAQAGGNPCFGFFVTFQGHGPYNPDASFDKTYLPQGDIPAEEYNLIEDYFQQAGDTCRQIALLVDELRMREEPVVLVLFGDHNPFLGKNGFDHLGINMDTATEEGFYNYYSTPYLIWGNDAAKAALGNDLVGQGPVISPEFLVPTVFSALGWEGDTHIQVNAELARRLPVIHKTGRFLENGALTDAPLPEHYDFYRSVLSYQYWWQSQTEVKKT